MLTIQTQMLRKCPACGSSNFHQVQTALDFETKTGEYDILECGSCGIGFTNPQPLEDEIPRLYTDRTSTDFPKVNVLTTRLRKASIKRSVKKLMREINAIHIDALEYGCGDGAFAACVAEHPQVRIMTAVDFHSEAPALLDRASSSKLKYVPLAQFEQQATQFDIVFLRHVLEHSFQPHLMLEKIWARLNPGGTLVVEVPNFESVGRTLFGRNYFALYLPRHLYHFRIQSLKRLVQRYFRIVSVTKTHTPVWGKSIANISRLNIPNTGLLGIGTFPFQVLVDIIARTSSVITLVARRES